MMSTSSGFDLVRDEITRLKGVGHALCTHTNTIADTDSSKLVANEV